MHMDDSYSLFDFLSQAEKDLKKHAKQSRSLGNVKEETMPSTLALQNIHSYLESSSDFQYQGISFEVILN